METINVDNALHLASEGLGIALVTDSVKKKASQESLIYFKLNESKYKNTIVIAYNKNFNLSKAAKLFLNLAIMRFNTL